jgi:aspartyl-tRNA(Asn)/glutamyl-tRNA(Gln) amidotransferase subunit A
MTTPARLPDWSSLPAGVRPAAIAQALRRLTSIGRRLRATAQTIDSTCAADGPLGGMPYVAKDMIATGVTASSWGCEAPLEAVGNAAPLIARLGNAGACLIGTAEMTELAYEPSGFNAVRGSVLNPWNVDIVPGGSSSGSAALVAAGCCFAALGSDTGGSVRIPAHCCGVTALKPTWGALPLDGTMPLAPSLDTIGLFARSAADVGLLWNALNGGTAAASSHVSGVVLEDAFAESDSEIARLCRNAIAVFGMPTNRRAGFPKEADDECLLVMQAEAARSHAARLADTRVDATLRKRLSKGLAINEQALARSLAARSRLRDDFFSSFLGDADVAFLPVMPIRTPRTAETDPASPDFSARTLYALSRFTRFVNYLGLPALAVPAGFDGCGLPVGLQIVGRPGSESLLIALAAALQSKTNWHGRVPTAIASDIAAEKGLAA